MSEERGYNGWSNYETWNAALWLSNDQGSQEHCDELARECLERAIENDESEPKQTAANAMAEQIEREHEDAAEEWMSNQTGFFADLFNAALREVNWHEIARHYVDEIEVYCAGWNMPGYMPDNPPAQFLDFDDARSYIADMLQQHADDDAEAFDNPEDTPVLDETVAWIKEQKKDFTAHAGNYAYWVSKL